MTQRAAALSRIDLDWPVQDDFRAVGRLVIGGVAARTSLPVDRVDELGLGIDALARVPVADDRLRLEIDVEESRLVAAIGAFTSDPLGDPSILRVVDALADEVRSEQRGELHWAVLSMQLPDGG